MASQSFKDLIPELVSVGLKVVDIIDNTVEKVLDSEPSPDPDPSYHYIHTYLIEDGQTSHAFTLGPFDTRKDALLVQNFLTVNKIKGRPVSRWVVSNKADHE